MIGLPRLIKSKSEKASLPPGSMVFIGDVKTEASTLTIIDYDYREFIEKKVKTIDECLPFKDLPTVTWFNVTGLHQTDVIERMGGYFELHPLLACAPQVRRYVDDIFSYLRLCMKDS